MLNFTKHTFDKFVSSYCDGKPYSVIVTKQHITANGAIIGVVPNIQNLVEVVVVQGRTFYQDSDEVNVIARLKTNQGITYNSNTKLLSLSSGYVAPISGEHLVVYEIEPSMSQEWNKLFDNQGINLVSIDYVGCDVGTISTAGCNLTYFKEADYSNIFDYPSDSLAEVTLMEGQNIYFGNHNDISIQSGAFGGTNIKRLVFPDSGNATYTIPANAFAGCTDLREVVIPDCITAIGAGAFSDCTNLEYVYIGSGVTNIGGGAFNKCVNIAEFIVSPDNPKYLGFDGCLMSRNTTPEYTYTIEFANHNWWDNQYQSHMHNIFTFTADSPRSMPQGISYGGSPGISTLDITIQPGSVYMAQVAGLPHDTFYTISGFQSIGTFVTPSNLQTILNSFPYSPQVGDYFYLPIYYFITNIADDACSGDTYITSVNLSRYKSLMNIGNNAFKGCVNLTSLTLPPACDLPASNEGSFVTSCAIGTSAFEGCIGLYYSITFGQKFSFGDKAFRSCANVTTLIFYNQIISIGTQSFSNLPSLTSISSIYNTTSSVTQNTPYYCPSNSNSIVKLTTVNNVYEVVVGCSGTSFTNIGSSLPNNSTLNVGDYAFYGCLNYNVSSNDQDWFRYGNINKVGNYGFYGCSSFNYDTIFIPTISNYAFYGCTSLTNLTLGSTSVGTKAFGNSGIVYLQLDSTITSLADDAFDGCIILNITADERNGSACRVSSASTENSLLKRNSTNPSINTTLVKSGSGKDIVNTTYYNPNKQVHEIKANAFTGINVNNGSNTTIHIPESVENIGANIFSGSTINGDVTGGNTTNILQIEQKQWNVDSVSCTSSELLLWLLGARYFKNMITTTASDRAAGINHWYEIASSSSALNVYENGANLSQKLVLTVQFNNNRVELIIYARLLPGYSYHNVYSHISTLNTPINLVLMNQGQQITSNEFNTYFDSDIYNSRGGTWQTYNIPNDLTTSYVPWMKPITATSSFANCKWVTRVKSGRMFNNTNIFKDCTRLQTIEALSSNSYSDYNLFKTGAVPEGTFDGCTAFTNIASSQNKTHPVPIIIGKNAFRGTSFNDNQMLTLSDSFDSGSFEETGLSDINLVSARNIDPKAFVGCNLLTAKSDSPCGVYFTGYGNNIVDVNYKIVVGSADTNFTVKLDDRFCCGIGDYAYYERRYNHFGITVPASEVFTVGNEAFAGSNIESFDGTASLSDISIGKGAFKNCTNLTRFECRGCNLRESAFSGCTSLTTVNIPRTVRIPTECFSQCTSLVRFILGSDVDDKAFSGCSNLVDITLSYPNDSDAIINPTAFIGCPITDFTIESGSPDRIANYYFTHDGIYDKLGETLMVGIKACEHSMKNVKTIGANAFNGRGITGAIVIPGTVTRIEDYAFANNTGITSVSLPPTVEYIGANAFAGCTSLVSATLPDSCEFIGAGAFKGCPLTNGFNCNAVDKDYHDATSVSTTALNGPANNNFTASLDLTKCKSYTSVTSDAFYGTGIQIIKLPETVASVGERCFKDCAKLTELHITRKANGTFTFNEQSLYGCPKLSDIYIYNNITINSPIDSNWVYGTGVDAPNPLIHIPAAMNTSTFLNSLFCLSLRSQNFTVVVDM